jgi:hypothetical protein
LSAPVVAGCVVVCCANAGAAASKATAQAVWSNRACAIINLLPVMARTASKHVPGAPENVVDAPLCRHHFMLREHHFGSCAPPAAALYGGLWHIRFLPHDFGTAGIPQRLRIVQI